MRSAVKDLKGMVAKARHVVGGNAYANNAQDENDDNENSFNNPLNMSEDYQLQDSTNISNQYQTASGQNNRSISLKNPRQSGNALQSNSKQKSGCV